MMLLVDFLKEIIVSLSIGTLIGIEREHHFTGTKEFAGIRTFAFISLFGSLCAILADTYSPWIVLLGLLTVSFLTGLAYLQSFKIRKTIGLTTEVVFVIAYTLGAMIHTMGPEIPIALSILITFVLTLKGFTARLSSEIKDVELEDTLKFAIIAFIILPLLPNQYIDPYNIINPYQLWLLVIFISGISFFGYFLMKLLGTGKGIILTSALGGLASSTAVSVALSNEVRRDNNLIEASSVGVIIASTIMFFRVLLLVSIINMNVVPYLLPSFLVMGVAGALFSWFMMNGLSRFEHPLKLASPFSIIPALKFAAFFAFILVVSNFGNRYFGDAGVYVASAMSGLVDVDAIVLSLSQLLGAGISYKVASIAIVIASITNNLVKAAICFLFGNRKFGMHVLKVMVPVSLIGIGVALLL